MDIYTLYRILSTFGDIPLLKRVISLPMEEFTLRCWVQKKTVLVCFPYIIFGGREHMNNFASLIIILKWNLLHIQMERKTLINLHESSSYQPSIAHATYTCGRLYLKNSTIPPSRWYHKQLDPLCIFKIKQAIFFTETVDMSPRDFWHTRS
jgi:hypothetical protein